MAWKMGWQDGVLARFQESLDLMVKAGAEVVEVSCPTFVHALATYYLILPAEASSNLAKFDAMRYGLRVLPEGVDSPSAEEVMRATRDAGFGDEVKRRIILGTYALSSGYYDAYYGQAQKVRTLVIRDFDAAFEQADVLVSPTAPTTAFEIGAKVDDPLAMYLNDLATIPANLSGVPGISIPSGLAEEDGLPTGVADPGAGAGRRPGLPGGRRAGDTVARQWGGPLLAQAHRARRRRGHDRTLVPFEEVLEKYGPGARARGPRRARHRHQDVLRLPRVVRRGAQHLGLPGLPRLPGAMSVVNGKAVESAIRIGLALNCDIAEWCRFARKTTSTRTCRRTSRPTQYDEPIASSRATSTWRSKERPAPRPSGSRSSARTWRRTRQVAPRRRSHRSDPRRRLLAGGHRADIPLIESSPSRSSGAARRPLTSLGLRSAAARPDRRTRRLRGADGRGRPRADVNLSLAPGTDVLGTDRDQERDSFHSVERSVRYEMSRTPPCWMRGTGSSSRPGTGTRTPGSPPAAEKSDAEDYRYSPEPDLV